MQIETANNAGIVRQPKVVSATVKNINNRLRVNHLAPLNTNVDTNYTAFDDSKYKTVVNR